MKVTLAVSLPTLCLLPLDDQFIEVQSAAAALCQQQSKSTATMGLMRAMISGQLRPKRE